MACFRVASALAPDLGLPVHEQDVALHVEQNVKRGSERQIWVGIDVRLRGLEKQRIDVALSSASGEKRALNRCNAAHSIDGRRLQRDLAVIRLLLCAIERVEDLDLQHSSKHNAANKKVNAAGQ